MQGGLFSNQKMMRKPAPTMPANRVKHARTPQEMGWWR